MAVVLRLTRKGQTKRPFYRVVATEKTSPRDGKYLQVIGTYSTLTNPPTINLKEDLVRRWVESGAVPSAVVRDMIRKVMPNYIEGREKHALQKLQAARKARKARLAKAGGAKKPRAAKKAAKPAA